MIAVIGGGPAGILAAYGAGCMGEQVELYDHNEKIGKKLFITGKGRCNLTNACEIDQFLSSVNRNPSFLYSALYTFTNEDLMRLVESYGCRLKTERGSRVFPVSDKSSDVIKALTKVLIDNGVKIYTHSHVSDLIIKDNTCYGIVVNGEKKFYDAVILCSGGLSYPSTGSDGSGYKIAASAGHKIVPPEPALVGINIKEDFELSGLTLKNVELTLYKNKKVVFRELGECLFTHTGISGPIALSASCLIDKPYRNYRITLDLKPGLNRQQLDKRILRDFDKNKNKDFQNALGELLPKSLIPVVVKVSGISPTKKVNSITKEERNNLIDTLKAFSLTVESLGRIEGAIVTRGGVSTKEINPNTMESKIIKNLYFAGEMIDVDAKTGGYNIQIACSTGYLAGISAGEVIHGDSN